MTAANWQPFCLSLNKWNHPSLDQKWQLPQALCVKFKGIFLPENIWFYDFEQNTCRWFLLYLYIILISINILEYHSTGSDRWWGSIGWDVVWWQKAAKPSSKPKMTQFMDVYINGVVPDCSITIANALEILQCCTKPLICDISPS